MAQGKLKVKSKCPPSVKQKKKQTKGPAISKRSNRPMKPKKNKNSEASKLKKMITKTVNKSVEEEIRNRALPAQNLSKIQEAIAKHNKT
ncbi:Protein of unknown function (DUF2462) [Popillia japonica]|uniref:Uncharacterized protein n=1 Tax=Popillia japonica TaxID=7064 RepID=A0AAW1LRM5_POPJA